MCIKNIKNIGIISGKNSIFALNSVNATFIDNKKLKLI